ncbi:MAG: hypothetical protein P8Q31_00485 [Luminiphilus sp.]|nr:hypothetical protein [Luminiphilus sp.]MDG1459969.1 hypothetical protein [Luminiphilus sp.]
MSHQHLAPPLQRCPLISKDLTSKTYTSDVAAFVSKAKAIRTISSRQSRLVFALDATASRDATWQTARRHHRELYDATAGASDLAVQLCYYRGINEFNASPWLTSGRELCSRMDGVTCEGGPTQIARLLNHYLEVGTPVTPVRALIFIGDAVEERSEALLNLAGQCRLKVQPIFTFQEGTDPIAARIFSEMARISGGAYAALGEQTSVMLQRLLAAVARYATGGRQALTQSGTESDRLLLSQLPK